MAECKKPQRRNVKPCIGQMNKQIILQDRAISAPTGTGVDYGESFTDSATVWALAGTVRGETIFDATGTEQDITHKFYIRYISGITSETWIEFNDEKLDIIDVENLDDNDDFLLIRANRRGAKSVNVNLS